MNYFLLRIATLSDRHFLVDTTIGLESGTDKLFCSTIFGITLEEN